MSYSGNEKLNHTGASQDGSARIQTGESQQRFCRLSRFTAGRRIKHKHKSDPALVAGLGAPSITSGASVNERGSCEEKREDRRGKWTDHDRGSSLWCRNVARRAPAAVKYGAREWRFPWKCITAATERESSPCCRHAFLPAASNLMFHLHMPVRARDRHAHTNSHCRASKPKHIHTGVQLFFFFKWMMIFLPIGIYILIKSPQSSSGINLFLCCRKKNKPTTPEAESAGWIRSVLSNTQTICILSSLLCMQGFILTQTVAYVYAAPKYNNHKKNKTNPETCISTELPNWQIYLWAAIFRYGSVLSPG